MSSSSPPHWQLPPGVTRGLWDYVRSREIAEDYDEYFAFNTLFEFDEQVLARHFKPPGVVVDLGCGTGRALVPLVESEDPLDAGLEIMCMPPGKKLSTLSLLSGGEQTLTATAEHEGELYEAVVELDVSAGPPARVDLALADYSVSRDH